MEQAARKRIARRHRAVDMCLVERSAGSHAVSHVPVLEERVTGNVLWVPGTGSIQRAASSDLETTEALADITPATNPRRRGRDQITARTGVNAVSRRCHLRRVTSVIDAAPERVTSRIGDLAGSYRERRARGVAMLPIRVLGIRPGAVCLDLSAVGRTVEGDDESIGLGIRRRIDGRMIVTATHQDHQDKEGSHGRMIQEGGWRLQLRPSTVLQRSDASRQARLLSHD